MKVYLTRDSVAMGDDADAPHEDTRELPAEVPVREAVASVVRSGYLAPIAGGRASWVLTGAGASIAVVAQQWEEPRFLISEGSSLASLATGDGVVEWHFRYLAQQDPVAVHEELRAAQAT
ncbi:hypothetical protein [Streptomyces rimosus]|uniref:hypothetical protein n=1 Tax=Streptomyces rimosus TaxID=1927 RepID=UPI00067C8768|nr:hypothetical protein [Streptomyces rimosus]